MGKFPEYAFSEVLTSAQLTSISDLLVPQKMRPAQNVDIVLVENVQNEHPFFSGMFVFNCIRNDLYNSLGRKMPLLF